MEEKRGVKCCASGTSSLGAGRRSLMRVSWPVIEFSSRYSHGPTHEKCVHHMANPIVSENLVRGRMLRCHSHPPA